VVLPKTTQRCFLKVSKKTEEVGLYVDKVEQINSMKIAGNILKESVISR